MRKWSAIVMVMAGAGMACEPVTEPLATEDVDQLWGASTRLRGARRVIVTVAERENPAAVAASWGIDADHVFTTVLNGFSGRISDAARSGLMRDARVVSIHDDVVVQHQQLAGPPWGLDRIDQRSNSLDGLYESAQTGMGVTAYIVDSGINYAHDEFEGRASPGMDVYGGDGSDCHGHGTHVAGTVGGRTYGVAKQVRLVSVKTLGCYGSGSVTLIIAGLDWVAANATRPAVVNLSVAAPVYDPLDRAVRALSRAGIPVVVAAANYNRDACDYSPAREPSAITVGASTQQDWRAWFSNWGPCVDLFAPGDGIVSADYLNAGGSTSKSGTSMSAPHATGVAALYLERNPDASSDDVQGALKAAATHGVVQSANSENNHMLFTNSAAPADSTITPPDSTITPPDSTVTPPDSTITPPPSAPTPIVLGGSASKQKSTKSIALDWTNAEGMVVEILLNGASLTSTANDGSFTYQASGKGRMNFEFQVCELEAGRRCSNKWTMTL